ncbi:YggT family protein [Candidatus Poribacteria bacterium]|nr:YggT family protein [Candidatus Poribacteria bacterium]
MFIIGNLINAIAYILSYLLGLYNLLIVIRAALSWVSADPYNPIVHFIVTVTEPFLSLIRTFIPMRRIGFDISPIIAFGILVFIDKFFIATLFDIAIRLH